MWETEFFLGKTCDGGMGSTRLVQDLLSLERDFQYNLGLLRVRDKEIARCVFFSSLSFIL